MAAVATKATIATVSLMVISFSLSLSYIYNIVFLEQKVKSFFSTIVSNFILLVQTIMRVLLLLPYYETCR